MEKHDIISAFELIKHSASMRQGVFVEQPLKTCTGTCTWSTKGNEPFIGGNEDGQVTYKVAGREAHMYFYNPVRGDNLCTIKDLTSPAHFTGSCTAPPHGQDISITYTIHENVK